MTSDDPTVTDPSHYKVLFENERVRVLSYEDRPGDRTHVHRHPDSVMYTLSSFRRSIIHGDESVEVSVPAGAVRWVGAQEHAGHNIGDTETHGIFIELKEPDPRGTGPTVLGPG